MDAVEEAIQNTRSAVSKSHSIRPSRKALRLLTALEGTQQQLMANSEALYASLNVHESFPELRHVNLEFLRILLLARDLKINIRKRAIGSFFEWEKLDRAVGGKAQPLGTPTLPKHLVLNSTFIK